MAGSTTKIADSGFIRGLTNNAYIGGSISYCPTYSEIQTNEPQLTIANGYTSTRLVVEDDITGMILLDKTYPGGLGDERTDFTDGYLNISQNYGFSLQVLGHIQFVRETETICNLLFSTFQSDTVDVLGARLERVSSGSTNWRFGCFAKNSNDTNQYTYSTTSWTPSQLEWKYYSVLVQKSVGSKTISFSCGLANSNTGQYTWYQNLTKLTPSSGAWKNTNCTYLYVGNHPRYAGMSSGAITDDINIRKTF